MLEQYIFWVDQTGFISPPNQNSDSTSLKAVYSSRGCRRVTLPFANQHLLFSIKSFNLEIYMRKFTLPFSLYQNGWGGGIKTKKEHTSNQDPAAL